MIESPTPSKFEEWKRPLIGGLLAALIIGGGSNVVIRWDPQAYPNLIPLIFLPITIGFIWPAYIIGLVCEFCKADVFVTIFMPIFWFLAGATMVHYVKDNKKVFLYWFLLFITGLVVSFVTGIFGYYF